MSKPGYCEGNVQLPIVRDYLQTLRGSLLVDQCCLWLTVATVVGNRCLKFDKLDHLEQSVIAAAILAGDDAKLLEALRDEIARMQGKSATF